MQGNTPKIGSYLGKYQVTTNEGLPASIKVGEQFSIFSVANQMLHAVLQGSYCDKSQVGGTIVNENMIINSQLIDKNFQKL